MEELKPCPFCGSEAHVVPTHIADGSEFAEVVCCDCYASVPSVQEFSTEEEAVSSAIEAWNRREERTCRMVDCSTHDTCVVNHEMSNGNVMSMEFGYRQCSECGAYVFDCPTVRYCPNCGARVIGEETRNVD